jgi:hypothetical protein
MEGIEFAGGCLCGAVRYRAGAEPIWVAYCHCASCRRATGAPVTAYAGFPAAAFTYVAGAPAHHVSSPGVRRSFCSRCGTPLTYEGERWPGEVHVLLGTLDRPERLEPQRHAFREEQIPWLRLDDADEPERSAGS